MQTAATLARVSHLSSLEAAAAAALAFDRRRSASGARDASLVAVDPSPGR